jgi:hypothetical protein
VVGAEDALVADLAVGAHGGRQVNAALVREALVDVT